MRAGCRDAGCFGPTSSTWDDAIYMVSVMDIRYDSATMAAQKDNTGTWIAGSSLLAILTGFLGFLLGTTQTKTVTVEVVKEVPVEVIKEVPGKLDQGAVEAAVQARLAEFEAQQALAARSITPERQQLIDNLRVDWMAAIRSMEKQQVEGLPAIRRDMQNLVDSASPQNRATLKAVAIQQHGISPATSPVEYTILRAKDQLLGRAGISEAEKQQFDVVCNDCLLEARRVMAAHHKRIRDVIDEVWAR